MKKILSIVLSLIFIQVTHTANQEGEDKSTLRRTITSYMHSRNVALTSLDLINQALLNIDNQMTELRMNISSLKKLNLDEKIFDTLKNDLIALKLLLLKKSLTLEKQDNIDLLSENLVSIFKKYSLDLQENIFSKKGANIQSDLDTVLNKLTKNKSIPETTSAALIPLLIQNGANIHKATLSAEHKQALINELFPNEKSSVDYSPTESKSKELAEIILNNVALAEKLPKIKALLDQGAEVYYFEGIINSLMLDNIAHKLSVKFINYTTDLPYYADFPGTKEEIQILRDIVLGKADPKKLLEDALSFKSEARIYHLLQYNNRFYLKELYKQLHQESLISETTIQRTKKEKFQLFENCLIKIPVNNPDFSRIKNFHMEIKNEIYKKAFFNTDEKELMNLEWRTKKEVISKKEYIASNFFK